VEELRLQTERERELERSNVEMENKLQQLEQKILELENKLRMQHQSATSRKLYMFDVCPPWPAGRPSLTFSVAHADLRSFDIGFPCA